MPDRSSHQGLPEDWDHGSHTAHGPFSAPGASDGHGAGPTGSHRAGAADGYGTGPTAAYSGPSSDALGAGPDLFGTGKTDAYAIRPSDTYSAGAGGTFGAGAADAFAVRPSGSHGGGTIGGHGAGTADPFGNADPFGARNGEPFGNGDPFGARNGESFGNGDPFGSTPTAAFAAVTAEAGTARPAAERPAAAIDDPAAGEAGDVRGFLSALFDFGFTSFVAPKVIKVLYVLIVIGTVVSALVFTTIAFKASLVFGLLTLVFGDPLFILIVLAIYRIILEIFMVTFRAAEDIRAVRERDDRRRQLPSAPDAPPAKAAIAGMGCVCPRSRRSSGACGSRAPNAGACGLGYVGHRPRWSSGACGSRAPNAGVCGLGCVGHRYRSAGVAGREPRRSGL